MEAYSRDSMAGPLRHLLEVVAKIRGGTFKPDLTRSGCVVAETASSMHSSGSASSGSTSSSSSDTGAAAKDDPPEIVETDLAKDIVLNLVTGYCHVLSGDALVCPKAIPKKASYHSEPPAGARLFSRCF